MATIDSSWPVSESLCELASYLTDPVCKAHEYYRRAGVVDALDPTASRVTRAARKIFLWMGLMGWAALALFTAVPGIGCRSLGARLQEKPFFHMQGHQPPKSEEGPWSLYSWNICGISGGYPISDGGVVPLWSRIDGIIDKIVEKDADVNCLYEVFDFKAATYICKKLAEKGYRSFYCNIGPQAVGVSSGILVASKYQIENPEFSLFPKDSLVGRTKYAAKGVFSFDLKRGENCFAKIFATHLQHSEISAEPTDAERKAREAQMQIIVDKVNQVRDRCIVVTGDLNLDEAEYQNSSWQHSFTRGDQEVGNTWLGDEFCAKLVGKTVSGPLKLDHTMVLKGTSMQTLVVDVGYDPKTFTAQALSDHCGLYSTIIHK